MLWTIRKTLGEKSFFPRWELPGQTPDLLNQHLHFNKIPDDSYVHVHLNSHGLEGQCPLHPVQCRSLVLLSSCTLEPPMELVKMLMSGLTPKDSELIINFQIISLFWFKMYWLPYAILLVCSRNPHTVRTTLIVMKLDWEMRFGSRAKMRFPTSLKPRLTTTRHRQSSDRMAGALPRDRLPWWQSRAQQGECRGPEQTAWQPPEAKSQTPCDLEVMALSSLDFFVD